jgi:hypothetical protein
MQIKTQFAYIINFEFSEICRNIKSLKLLKWKETQRIEIQISLTTQKRKSYNGKIQ